jgi:hypothetical protein
MTKPGESESDIQARVMLAIGSRPDCRIFRNHVGMGWSGKLVKQERGRVLLDNARPARFGLAPGSGDLIGWKAVTITPEMVGRKIAVFLSAEVKTLHGAARELQTRWAQLVDKWGGIAGFVRSPDDAVALVEGGLL